jgi:hypothetical protein
MTDNPDKVHPVIEAVAKVLAEQDGHDWHDMPPYREGYYRVAKAAAKVLLSMEPTEGMIHDGHLFDPLGCDIDESDAKTIYGKIWLAMTSRAREEMGV